MPDLDPHPHLELLEDPSVTRLMPRRVNDGRTAELLRADGQVATSVSVVLLPVSDDLDGAVAAVNRWSPPHIRLELLAMASRSRPTRPSTRERLVSAGSSWRLLDRPAGGRAAALARAAEQSENEFVVVGGGGEEPYDLVHLALGAMWSQGGDAALCDTSDASGALVPEVDAATELVDWLGLNGSPANGRLVILRRWVARWLFNEVTRAISPAEEVADRARLLGLGIVVVERRPAD